MSRLKEKRHTIWFEAFHYRLTVLFTNDVCRSTKKYDPNFTGGSRALYMFDYAERPSEGLLILPFKASCGVIAHESWHVVHSMLEYCGAALDKEVVAYHLDYTVTCIHKLIKKRRA